MSTRIKVVSGTIVTLLLTVILFASGIFYITGLMNTSDMVQTNSDRISFFLSKTIDHLNWDRKLSGYVYGLNDEHVEADPRKCNLGKWYYQFLGSPEFMSLAPDIREKLRSIEKPHEELHRSADQIRAYIQRGEINKGRNIYENVTAIQLSSLQKTFFSIKDDMEKSAMQARESMRAIKSRSTTIFISVFLVSFLVGGVVMLMSYRSLGILEKLKPFIEQFSRGALGDMTVRYPLKKVNCSAILDCGKKECPDFGKDDVMCWFDVGSYAPDFGKQIHCPKILNKVYDSCRECKVYRMVNTDEVTTLASWYNKFIGNLHDMVVNLRRGIESLVQAVEQIAGGNQNLSQRTSEQASFLEEISSTIEQSVAGMNQNAENTDKSRTMMDGVSSRSTDGKHIADEAVSSIREMNEASRKVADIITVINGIAFQTNILALNAAVEAARAGEQGRGFAVVAGEVRNLAQRTGNEARQIENLINDAIEKVEKSTDLVTRTGATLDEIVEMSGNTSRIIQEIATSSDEQRQGFGQINSAVIQMESMTQQNAALVEETASAAEEMSGQAQTLSEEVKKFKVNEEGDSLNFS